VKLSILIASLNSRSAKLKALVDKLGRGGAEFEVLTCVDSGQSPIGAKRQKLLTSAQGDFVVGIDDDDRVPDDYVPTILAHCVDGVDCIGFWFDCYGYGKPGQVEKAIVSRRYGGWKTNDHNSPRYERCPHHLVPVRRDLALKAGFDTSKRDGEDYAFSMRLLPLLSIEREHFIDRVMYTIHHTPNKKRGQ